MNPEKLLMKKIFYTLAVLLILASCKTSRETKSDVTNGKKIINVIINPITGRDSAFFFTKESGRIDNTNKRFQQYLANELTSALTNQYHVVFYTLNQAKKESIKPDWIVDLTMDSVDILLQDVNYANLGSSKRYLESSDAAGHRSVPYNAKLGNLYIYRTKDADLVNSTKSYVAVGQLEVKITDARSGKNIYSDTYNKEYYWDEGKTYYSGDDLISGNGTVKYAGASPVPGKADILKNLYLQFYPQIKSNVYSLVAL
jgi:hypothetical protein